MKIRPLSIVFKPHPRDTASINAMNQTCVIVILAYSFEHPQFMFKLMDKKII